MSRQEKFREANRVCILIPTWDNVVPHSHKTKELGMSAYHSVNQKQATTTNSTPANRRSPSSVSSADTGPASSDVGMSERDAGGAPPQHKSSTAAPGPVEALGSGSCTWREFATASIKERLAFEQEDLNQAAADGYFDSPTGAPSIDAIDVMSKHWQYEGPSLVLRVVGDDEKEYRYTINKPGADISSLDDASAWCLLTVVTPDGPYLPGVFDWCEPGEGDLCSLIIEAESLAGMPQLCRERARQYVTPIQLDDLDIPFYTEADAERAVDKINGLSARLDRIKASCKAAIAAAAVDLADAQRSYEWHLERYAAANLPRGRKSVHLATGEIGFTAQKKDKIKVEDNAIAAQWALEMAPHAVKKVESRKVIAAEMQKVFEERDGKPIPGCSIKRAGERFWVRAPKGGAK